MQISKTAIFVIILFLFVGLLFIKLNSINNDNTNINNPIDVVDTELKAVEVQNTNSPDLAKLPQSEYSDLSKIGEAEERELESIDSGLENKLIAQSVGDAGDSIGAESELLDYLTDYAYDKNLYYIETFNCASHFCEVSIKFFERSDDMTQQLSNLMRNLPWKPATVDDISFKDWSAKITVSTDQLK